MACGKQPQGHRSKSGRNRKRQPSTASSSTTSSAGGADVSCTRRAERELSPFQPNIRRRGRGRPRVSAQHQFYFLQDYYIFVETIRAEKFPTTRERRSVRQACRLLERRGGLAWIGEETRQGPGSAKTCRFTVEERNGKRRFRRAENGRVHVQRLIQSAETIETRYYEAVRLAERDANIKFAWDNMVRVRCRLPPLPVRIQPPPGWHIVGRRR
jgi:hypothetical protein